MKPAYEECIEFLKSGKPDPTRWEMSEEKLSVLCDWIEKNIKRGKEKG